LQWPRVFLHISSNKDDDSLLDQELFPVNTYVYCDEFEKCMCT
jgi:hypothetical protein